MIGPAKDEERASHQEGVCTHGDLVERTILTVLGNDNPHLLIRVLGPVAAQAVLVESVAMTRPEDRDRLEIALVLRSRLDVAKTIARNIGRLVDVARVTIAADN